MSILLLSLSLATLSHAYIRSDDSVFDPEPALPFSYTGELPLGGYMGGGASTQNTRSCSSPTLTCHNTTAIADSCCFEYPGGELLQTQFWDSDPATGPDDSWTIHGLWPDNCGGRSYQQNCDHTRFYRDIPGLLEKAGRHETLEFMREYWLAENGDDEHLWQHEWSKHGTCLTTLSPSCYSDYKSQQEAADYFEVAVNLFKTLDSYEILKAANITPTYDRTYETKDIQAALSAAHGAPVRLGCRGGKINEIWYFFNVRGGLTTGQFVPSDSEGMRQGCQGAIKYEPKNSNPRPSPPSPTHPTNPSPTGPILGRGYLKVANEPGCIISKGSWYATGSCATFTASRAALSATDNELKGVILKSHKGSCGTAKDGSFKCGSGVREEVFEIDETRNGQVLKKVWHAKERPHGRTKVWVYEDEMEGGLRRDVEVKLKWEKH